MKKISLFILAIALTITSCKNYDDDFKELNASIAELQAQVAGFSAVQTNIAALQASMASLTTAVASIPTTQVDISGLTSGLAASNASIAALQAQLAATNVTIAALQTQLAGIVANYATTGDVAATTAAIANLAAQIVFIQDDIAEILAANNIYDEDLNITNSSELEFAVGLGNKVAVVNGRVYINTTGLTVAEVATLATVTSKIYSIVGDGMIALDITATKNVDFSNLASAGGYVLVYSPAAAVVNLAALTTVTGDYYVDGVNAMDDALKTVTGSVNLNYDGGYEQPNLVSAASVTLTDYETGVSLGGDAVGTLAVNFRGLTSGNINSGVLTLKSATSVILNKGVTNLTANAATDVQVWASNSVGLTIEATEDDSVITIAGTVLNGANGAALKVTGSATSVLNAAAVTKTSTLDVVGIETALSFPALTVGGVVAANDTDSFSAPLMVATSLSATFATTVNITSATVTAPALENITFKALAVPYTAASTLKTANVTGKVAGAGAFTSTTGTLISAAFAGELDAVSITGTGAGATDKLTTLTTTGAIDSFILDNSDTITSVSLGHSHIAGGAGSVLKINGNANLASLTTSTNYLRELTVTGNAKLATMNFASYVNVPTGGSYIITITGNKLPGAYSKAVAATGTTPYVETVITSTSLTTLKPWINAYKTANTVSSTLTESSLTMSINMTDYDAATAGAQTLSAAMQGDGVAGTAPTDFTGTTGDTANYTRVSAGAVAPAVNVAVGKKIDVTTGINIVYEFLLIQ